MSVNITDKGRNARPCSTPGHQDRPARPYARGYCCPDCAPGPEPGGRYCLAICYCGQHEGRSRPLAPIVPNVIDYRAVASGKRRAGLDSYREAQAATQKPQNHQRQGRER